MNKYMLFSLFICLSVLSMEQQTPLSIAQKRYYWIQVSNITQSEYDALTRTQDPAQPFPVQFEEIRQLKTNSFVVKIQRQGDFKNALIKRHQHPFLFVWKADGVQLPENIQTIQEAYEYAQNFESNELNM